MESHDLIGPSDDDLKGRPAGRPFALHDQVNVIAGTSALSRGVWTVGIPFVRRNGAATREELMTALSRRGLLAGAAAVTAAGSMNAPARAAAPMAGKQAPSFYRYKIGDFR